MDLLGRGEVPFLDLRFLFLVDEDDDDDDDDDNEAAAAAPFGGTVASAVRAISPRFAQKTKLFKIV